MQVEIRQKDHTLIAGLAGDWALENAPPRFDRLVEERPPGRTVHAVGFDTMELGAWDSSLLTFLLQGMNYCEAQDLAFELDDKALAFQGFKSGLGRFFCGVECYRR